MCVLRLTVSRSALVRCSLLPPSPGLFPQPVPLLYTDNGVISIDRIHNYLCYILLMFYIEICVICAIILVKVEKDERSNAPPGGRSTICRCVLKLIFYRH